MRDEPRLFQAFQLSGLPPRSRIGLAPVLTYGAERNHVTDRRLMHLGKCAAGGTGLVFIHVQETQE